MVYTKKNYPGISYISKEDLIIDKCGSVETIKERDRHNSTQSTTQTTENLKPLSGRPFGGKLLKGGVSNLGVLN